MFTYENRAIFSLRWMDADSRPSRSALARGELSQGAGQNSGRSPIGSSQSAPRPRIRWPRRRQERRADEGLPAKPPVLRLGRLAPLPLSPHGAGGRPAGPRSRSEATAEENRQGVVRITRRSSARDVAAAIAGALEHGGLRAVLSGGGCASIYTRGIYQSVDLDFILQGPGTQKQLDAAMASVEFVRRENQYFHSQARFYAEFPPGPLGIGADYRIEPVEIRSGGARLLLLSPTDSCRDRLTGFYHWNDRQGLEVAVRIAVRQDVDIEKIRKWSEQERALPRFEVFLEELERFRRRSRRRSQ